MTVCIDTNVLLQARPSMNRFHRILMAWMEGRFAWAVSNEIMLEYEEILTDKAGRARFEEFIAVWDMMLIGRPENSRLISPTFRHHLITACPDDDKFADCAIAADADYIITSDKHFNALIDSGYKPQPITPEEFIARHLTLAS